ncbi:MAG TPA: PH domain-containing protein [Candidatus Limivivens merdigallinarum]|uniref:PH domain-containing protein n=1 Tax=Candidatus Limivivens merdigallinarum TaxID=2840859 RepID=A0A9D1D3N3_9FIRM|nr:PH domain-containing protein [Candidatus Limivivens merdigallinarum]
MKIPGKVAPWFWAILLAGNALILYEMIVEKEKLAPLLVGLALLNLLCIPIVARNYVLLEEDKVTVVFGFLRDTMKFSEIERVYETHNPIAGSAASLDRIVMKGRHQELMCAVKDKQQLFDALEKRKIRVF